MSPSGCWRCRGRIRAGLGWRSAPARPGSRAADVDRELTEERSLLITWLNRGTLHLVRSEDYPLLQALTTPPLLTSCTRRLRQEGVSEKAAERGVETIERRSPRRGR